MYRNPNYTGITTEFWGSCDAVGGPRGVGLWGTPNCGKGQPGQDAHVGHAAAAGAVPERPGRGALMAGRRCGRRTGRVRGDRRRRARPAGRRRRRGPAVPRVGRPDAVRELVASTRARGARTPRCGSAWSPEGRTGVAVDERLSRPRARGAAAASALEMAERGGRPTRCSPAWRRRPSPPAKDGFDEATADADARGARRGRGGAGRRGRATGSARPAPSRPRPPRSRWRTPRASSATRRTTQAGASTVVSGGGRRRRHRGGRRRRSPVDARPPSAGARSRRRATARTPQDLEPGRYEVVLEPLAVSTLVGFLAYIGVQRPGDRRGPLAASPGKEGEQVARRVGHDRRRRARPRRDRPAVRLRGHAEAARDPDRSRRVPSAACTTAGAPSRRASTRPATGCRRRTPRARSR